jgi:uncharacterized protein
MDGHVMLEPRITLITLGVADIKLSRRFYEQLGFMASPASQESVTFMSAGGVVRSLFGRAALAADTQVKDSEPGFSGVTIAHDCRSEADVDAGTAHAVACGATLKKPEQKVFWGATRATWPIPTATCGKWRSTRSDPSMPTAACNCHDRLPYPSRAGLSHMAMSVGWC